ncbi:MAG: O-antigen ligase family protein [Planctomycetota bacterium]|nr:O-antigen ligase family protein [Planctomycetota bacterium]
MEGAREERGVLAGSRENFVRGSVATFVEVSSLLASSTLFSIGALRIIASDLFLGVTLLLCATPFLFLYWSRTLFSRDLTPSAVSVFLLSCGVFWQPSPFDIAICIVFPIALLRFIIFPRRFLILPFIILAFFIATSLPAFLTCVSTRALLINTGIQSYLVVVTFVTMFLVSNPATFQPAYKALIWACWVTVLVVLVQYVTYSIGGISALMLKPLVPAGLTSHHSLAALMIATAFFDSLVRVLFARAKEVLTNMVLVFVSLSALVFTESRGPLFALLLSLLGLGFLLTVMRIFPPRPAVMFICLILCLMFSPILFPRFFERYKAYHRYDENRVVGTQLMLEMTLDNPIGIGLGNFALKGAEYTQKYPSLVVVKTPEEHPLGRSFFRRESLKGEVAVTVHEENAYLKVFAEQGWIGGMLFLLIIGTGLMRVLRSFLLSNEIRERIMTLVLFLSLLTFAIDLLVCGGVYWRHLWILLGFSFASVWISGEGKSGGDISTRRSG